MQVPIRQQEGILIANANVQAALTDRDLLQLRHELVDKVRKSRAGGIIVDLTAMDVMDSFASRNMREMAHTIGLLGTETVMVGIQPDVAFAMVQMGLSMERVRTSLDLEEGLEYLQRQSSGSL